MFVGFGATPFFSEFTRGGRLLFDARLPDDDGSYRVFRFPWSATPTTRPAVAARRTAPGSVAVYASWNGATTVRRWQVLGGPEGGPLAPIGRRRQARVRDPHRRGQDRDQVRGAGAGGRRARAWRPRRR